MNDEHDQRAGELKLPGGYLSRIVCVSNWFLLRNQTDNSKIEQLTYNLPTFLHFIAKSFGLLNTPELSPQEP